MQKNLSQIKWDHCSFPIIIVCVHMDKLMGSTYIIEYFILHVTSYVPVYLWVSLVTNLVFGFASDSGNMTHSYWDITIT